MSSTDPTPPSDTKDMTASPSNHNDTTSTSQPPSCATNSPHPHIYRGLSWLDRLLVLWILLAIIIGILLGNFVPNIATTLQRGQFVGVSIPIAIGLLVMMYPILLKIQYETLHLLFHHRKIYQQLLLSILLNWIAAPLLMLGLAWAFLPDQPSLRNGLIFVGLARCIAMVLIWTTLAGGDMSYCAILVAFNSLLQLLLYAPLATLFVSTLNPSSLPSNTSVSYPLVAKSVGVFLGLPLGAAILTRLAIHTPFPKFYNTKLLPILSPFSLIGLLYTILILFASQGSRVVHQIVSVVRVAAPLIVYFLLTFTFTLFVCWKLRLKYEEAATQALTAASNNFELAIAVAVAVFGAGSDEALAAVVGPLVEVPVLVGLVWVLKWGEGRWGRRMVGKNAGEGGGEAGGMRREEAAQRSRSAE